MREKRIRRLMYTIICVSVASTASCSNFLDYASDLQPIPTVQIEGTVHKEADWHLFVKDSDGNSRKAEVENKTFSVSLAEAKDGPYTVHFELFSSINEGEPASNAEYALFAQSVEVSDQDIRGVELIGAEHEYTGDNAAGLFEDFDPGAGGTVGPDITYQYTYDDIDTMFSGYPFADTIKDGDKFMYGCNGGMETYVVISNKSGADGEAYRFFLITESQYNEIDEKDPYKNL